MNTAAIIGIAITLSIFLTVLGFGMQATLDDALYLFRRPGDLLRAVLSMNAIMIVFAVSIILVFRFDPIINVALVALAVSPVPPILPNSAFKKGGRRSYTMGLLAAISLLSIVIVPLALGILEKAFDHPVGAPLPSILQNVVLGVVIPLIAGIVIHHFFPAFAERFANAVAKIGLIILILVFLLVIVSSLGGMWTLIGNGTILAFVAFAIVGLTAGHLLGGPDPNDRTVLAISSASRHPGIAIAITAANSADPKLASAAIFLYLIVSGIVTGPYLKWLQGRGKTAVPDMGGVGRV